MTTIAAIDDDPVSLQLVSTFIHKLGHQVYTFLDGQEFLDQLHQGHIPDIVLTDLYMPSLSGLELLGKVHKQHASIPVIVMTGTRDFFSTVNALNGGAYGYLLKPILYEEMKNVLDRAGQEQLLQHQLLNQHQRLENAQRKAELATLAAGIAHEINNPNCTIAGNMEFAIKMWKMLDEHLAITDVAENAEQLRYARNEFPKLLDAVLSGSNRIQQIIKSMAVAQPNPIEKGGRANFRAGIEQARRTLGTKLRGFSVVTKDMAAGLSFANMQEDQLEQIMVSLLAFGAQTAHRPEDGVPTIMIQLSEGAKHTLIVELIGPDENVNEEILAVLEQGFSSNPPAGKETLLNLYIAHLLLGRCNGKLEAERRDKGEFALRAILPAS